MKIITTAALMLVAGPALGSSYDLPRQDVTNLCKRAAIGEFKAFPPDVKSTPQESYVACVDGEQVAYDWLKDRWPPLSENWQADCRREAGNTLSGVYRVMRVCLEKKFAVRDENLRKDREREAAQPVMPKKEFRY
ncbi:hypothetical protein [Methylobacterium oryzae]|uniref:hypothetical protein n=1 Tax=Methylobacterium oryzae TaxID=334852 RepID=UPI001F33DAA7|nr:hypothetical protein [Methylobacterium oryzae]UIN38405.1 hypothetical protein LXM90_30955 [Methylobacterium oryzae]